MGRKTTGWGTELKKYNMSNMKEFKLSRMHIVTGVIGVIGGFVIGLGSGYALLKYLRNLFLRTVPVTRLRAAPA